MSQKSYIVFGPQGCGKTTNARAIASALGLDKIVDDWQPDMAVPPDALVLTSHEGPFSHSPRRVLTYSAAIAMVESKKTGGDQ
ncbi:AAA family ATPase [Stutzerimonas kunmingensis]|uniref:AAA family ATPase n=1 Tax=Stutzerimonas kunmingensis TaxID=1211807 RepID=UPI00241C8FF9|nr:AAA family ATPase [Stutzerimonas kunmingensis]